MARILAQAISGPLGQQVIIENRGGSSIIIGEVVVNAAPDGYTMLFGAQLVARAAAAKDRVRSVCGSSRPSRSWIADPTSWSCTVAAGAVRKELIALAKARPGRAQLFSTASARRRILPAELFKSMAGVQAGAHSLQGKRAIDGALLSVAKCNCRSRPQLQWDRISSPAE